MKPGVQAGTEIGQVCPGDKVEFITLQLVNHEVWYNVRTTERAGACAGMTKHKEGWVFNSLLGAPSQDVEAYVLATGGELPAALTIEPTAAPRPAVRPPAPAASACDPSYPDICIPAGSADLDCGEIGYRRFRVVGFDPHGFDRDNDGIGCES